MKTGLVISGGGPRGSFAAGALQALAEKGVVSHYDVVAGTSTGALIAPFAAIGEFVFLSEMYRTVRPRDIYRKRWLPYAAVFRPGFYSMDPLREVLHRALTTERFDRILKSNVLLTTFDLRAAHTAYWATCEMPPSDRWFERRIAGRKTLLDAMVASASIPVVSDPVTILGRRYVDGGVRDHAPLSPLIKMGCDRIYAIVLSPPHITEREKIKGIFQIAERVLTGMSAEVLDGDLITAERMNDAEGYREIDLRIIRLTQSYVWGQTWTAEDMHRQWQHGFESALAEASKWEKF